MTTVGAHIRAARAVRGWSQQELADALSVARWGRTGRCSRHDVYRWEAGLRQPTRWLPFIHQVLGAPAAPADPPMGDTVAEVLALGRMDVQRREFLAAVAAGLGILGAPDVEAITRRVSRPGGLRVGRGEVTAVRSMTTALGDTASELGGGHARLLAVRYLTDYVGPWLNGTYTTSVGRELFAATSELVHLTGWMARDAGLHGKAQRYYLNSYRLATEAGAHELAATALRGLAEQAIDLGHIATAVGLAQACARAGRTLDNPKAVAYYTTTHARAAAADADRATASSRLIVAEHAIEHATTAPGQSWASHYSAGRWAHDSGMVLATLGDLVAAEQQLHIALDTYGIDRRRTRAMVLADLGQVQLKRGDTDQALASWQRFLDAAEGVQSVRISDSAGNIAARLAQLPRTSAVHDLHSQLRERQEALADNIRGQL
jgi:transcriptional regulator with XRE-family HTH domain